MRGTLASAAIWAILVVGSLPIADSQPAPPTNLDVNTGVGFHWTTGIAQLSWTASPTAVSYEVTLAPLSYTHLFLTAADAAAFIFDAGSGGSSIAVNNGGLELTFPGTATLLRSRSPRGTIPMAYRRLPLSGVGGTDSTLSLQVTVDCSLAPRSASSVSCGIVVYDAAVSAPLLLWQMIVDTTSLA